MINNGVIFQFFHWYNKPDGSLWNELNNTAKTLADKGITAVWIPPAYKGQGGEDDVGYGVYDLFDLGEFHQKNSKVEITRTKYGTKNELIDCIKSLQSHGIQVYADVVFNHKDGADHKELVRVQEVDWDERNNINSDWYDMEAWTNFTFPGRGNNYSSMKWNWWHFDSLSYNATTNNRFKLYRLKDKSFETDVSHEHQNYDYLMACDLDMSVEQVRGELFYWGRWFVEQTGIDGFRIDAVKHIRASFFPDWLHNLRSHFNHELFSVGEYWSGNVQDLHYYISRTGGAMSLFDVPLHYNLQTASQKRSSYNLQDIFKNTLVKENPSLAVTFVDNHDSQPCQSLESTVDSWFKPLAYALILLRRDGYPCIFYGDYYGAKYTDTSDRCKHRGEQVLYSHSWLIDKYLYARKAYGYGDQEDYFDHPNTIGWTRLGDAEHPGAMAVVMSNGSDGNKWMNVYRPNATFYDLTEHVTEKVNTNSSGWGNFICKGGSASIWLQI